MEEKNITSIGNYEAIEVFRKVPEGVLYKAVDKNSGNHVLLKLYYPSLVWSEDILNEFFNLISYLRFIEHNNLLPILDVGKYDGLPYVVFPDDSVTLLKDRHNPVSGRSELLGFFYKIADALDFLHKQEILHGILNTENIVVNVNGEPNPLPPTPTSPPPFPLRSRMTHPPTLRGVDKAGRLTLRMSIFLYGSCEHKLVHAGTCARSGQKWPGNRRRPCP